MRHILFILLLLLPFLSFVQSPEVVITNGHTDAIVAVDISPDGKWTATGALDKLIKITHNVTGQELRTFSGNAGRIEFVKFDDKSDLIGAKCNDDKLKFWDIRTGELTAEYDCHIAYGSFGFVLNNTKVLYVNEDGELCLFNPFKQEPPKKLGLISVSKFVASRDGKMAYCYDYQGRFQKVDLSNGEVVFEKAYNDEYVFIEARMDIDEKGKFIAVAFKDHKIHILNTSDFSTYHIFSGHEEKVEDLKFDEKSTTLFTLQANSTDLFSWDVKNKVLKKRAKVLDFGPRFIEPHPTQDFIVLTDWKDIKYVDRSSFKVNKIIQTKANRIMNMAYDQKGKYLAAASLDVNIKLWDLEQNKIVSTFMGFWPVAIDPNGNDLISNYRSIKLAIWDIQTGELKNELETGGDLIQKIAYSKDGSLLAGIGVRGKVHIWDMATKKVKKTIDWPPGMTYGVAISPDNKYVAASGLGNSFYVWDIETGELIKHQEGYSLMISDLSFTPDGKYLAASNWDGNLYLFDTKTWTEKQVFKGHTNVILTIDASDDGKYLVSGAGNYVGKEADNTAIVWEIESGKEICRFHGHIGGINKVIFDKKSTMVFSTGDDGTIKAWDYKTCNEVGTYVSVNDMDYIITTPDFYYMASKDAIKAIAFRIEDQLYPFDQFDLKLNRPDIVASRLGKTPQRLINAYNYVYKKRLKRMNFDMNELNDDFHLPEVSLLTQDIPLVTKAAYLEFEVACSDSKYLLDRINVTINGVPIQGVGGISLKDEKDKVVKRRLKVDLLPGPNQVQVSVLNRSGVESLRQTVSIVRDVDKIDGDLYLATVGVSSYLDERFNLKYPAKDARDIENTLKQAKGLYQNVYVKSLTDSLATSDNIIGLKSFFDQAKPNDAIILFVAGHGLLDENFNYYFATHAIDFDNPSKLGLPYEALDALLVETKAIKKILIMDTCHSGELDEDEIEASSVEIASADDIQFRNAGAGVRKKESFGMQNTAELMEHMFTDIRRGSGAHVISSAGGVEYAMEGDEWQNGLFTYCLLRGLENTRADANNNHEIVVSELKDYVYKEVKKLSEGKQVPTAREMNSNLDFRVW